MEKSLFSLTWDKFHSSMCAGFSLLQQNSELVDLTLAADGHFVKVHQIVLSIASSFIKDLIQSADCKHPVIFMNNVSYKTLCSILEYVYTGEVSVEEENLTSFFEAAKSLKIRGLDETVSASTKDQSSPLVNTDDCNTINQKTDDTKISTLKLKTLTTLLEKNSSNTKRNFEEAEQDETSLPKKRKCLSNPDVEKKLKFGCFKKDETCSDEDEDMYSGDAAFDSLDSISHASGEEYSANSENKESPKPISEFQYTVSNRGSLQMILNRYMYNLCSRGMSTARGPVRRWRCVDYRNHACPASATTDHNVVVKRINLHNHPFHDKRILAKIQRKAVYSAIQAKALHPDAAE